MESLRAKVSDWAPANPLYSILYFLSILYSLSALENDLASDFQCGYLIKHMF